MSVDGNKTHGESLGAMMIRMREELRGSGADDNRLRLCIHDSINHLNRTEHFNWMDLEFELALKADKRKYPMGRAVPNQVRYVLDDMWVDIDGDENNRHRVIRRTPDFLRDKREFQEYSNWPEYFAIEGEFLHLWPVPDGNHLLNFRGVAIFPAPRYSVTHEDDAAGEEAVWHWDALSFTNAWFEFDKGEQVARTYAMYLYDLIFTKDQKSAAANLDRHIQALGDSRAQTIEKAVPDRTDPWPQIMD